MNRIEIFSAGCPLCIETIERIKPEVCESCEVTVHDLHNPEVINRAKEYEIKRAPAAVVNGELSPCCKCSDIKIVV